MLKNEFEVREYLVERIWGITGMYEEDGFFALTTVNLIKLALQLGCKLN